MVRHPHLYEVNTRVLLSILSRDGHRATFDDIPHQYWQSLAERGIQWIWLMGVWELREKTINPGVITPEMMQEYTNLIPGLEDADIDGSTYAIHAYDVDPALGGPESLKVVKERLNNLGMRLMLDFIPNHFGAHNKWLQTHPEYFIEVSKREAEEDPVTYYRPPARHQKFFAHGKDPYFDAWQDTCQVNYANAETRKFMSDELSRLAGMCDGVRCDMAMLAVRRTFDQTWGHNVKWDGDEFWPAAIKQAKELNEKFVLLAEVYWDMEWELMKMGFDYCYDKTFYDRLSNTGAMLGHFRAEAIYLQHTARFLENHDEPRAAHRLSWPQHMAAAAMVAFGPGMRFWHMGQWEGIKIKVPVQIAVAPHEMQTHILNVIEPLRNDAPVMARFYNDLFNMTNQPLFHEGRCHVRQRDGLLLFEWQLKKEKAVVAINYSDSHRNVDIVDLLNGLRLRFPEGQSSRPFAMQFWPWAMCLWQSV